MALLEKAKITKDLRVGIGALLLARGGHNIDKALVVLHTLLGPAHFLFLLFGHLGNLTSYSPGTGQGTMDFTSKHAAGYFQSAQSAHSLHPTLAQGSLILQEQDLIFWNEALQRGYMSLDLSPGRSPGERVAPACRQTAACWRLNRFTTAANVKMELRKRKE